MNRNFSDGSQDAYAELPVNVTGLSWRRGNTSLAALRETDPAQYYGGWRGFVNDMDGNPNPKLPLPIVSREGDTGKEYQVYAAPFILFVPIQSRTRYELRQQVVDETGRERNKVVAISKTFIKGYEPHRQVFGLVLSRTDPTQYAPALLYINKWSSFISFEKAGEKFNKIKPQPNTIVVRKYGTNGRKVDDQIRPAFEVFGQSKSTPIEALGLDKPQFFVITDELNQLYDDSLPWKNCARWNASGNVPDEPRAPTPLEKFMKRAQELNLTDAEVAQILAQNGNNYVAALQDIDEVPEQEFYGEPEPEDGIPF